MKALKTLLPAIAVVAVSQQASAVPFEPDFSDYAFPGTQYNVDAAANTYFADNYGITIDNAYLYKDSRDTFDGIGISTGLKEANNVPNQIGTITFLDSTDFVTVDYWGIQPTTYSIFDASDVLLDTFSIGSNQLGTYNFSSSSLISYLTWESTGGYGQISALRYDYDGTTDGTNDDLATVPEPGSIALLSLGLAGIFASRRRANKAA